MTDSEVNFYDDFKYAKCTWLDLIHRDTNLSEYIYEVESNDETYSRNLLASIKRMVTDYGDNIIVFHFEDKSISVVHATQIRGNLQYRKAIEDLRDMLKNMISSPHKEYMLDILIAILKNI